MMEMDLFNRILFLILICFSFLIFIFTISMNKKNSMFKAFGMVFFLPFSLCTISFVFINKISLDYIYWLSETCMSIVFLILILFKGKQKNYSLVNFIILSMSIGLCILLKNNLLPLHFVSSKIQVLISVLIIILNLILLKYKDFLEKEFLTANILLIISVVLSLFSNQKHVLQGILILKFLTYLTFYIFFYKRTYGQFIDKIKEANKIKKSLNKVINRDVKKKMLHYEIAREKLLMKAKTDSLTKTYNKEAIFDIINDLISKNKQFSIMMFDIDDFKKINDTYGHIVGDVCIKKLVDTVKKCIREVDYLGRYGGDEFILVLPSLEIEQGMLIAQRLIKNVNMISSPKFTISIGISIYPHDGNTAKDLISIADEGLYYSKKVGKNTSSYINTFDK